MPFINTKFSGGITAGEERELKERLGKAITAIGKTESWLMLGFERDCCLYFKGEKRDKLIYAEVSLLGSASGAACTKMTGELCRAYSEVLGVSPDNVYVKYSFTDQWGWNNMNF